MRFPTLSPGETVLRYESIQLLRGSWGTGITNRVIVTETVARVTATQAVTESGLRFTLRDGTIIGMAERGGVYPVGYVDKFARNAMEARPMEPTGAARVQQLHDVAKSLQAFDVSFSKFDKGGLKLIRHVLQTHGNVTGAAMLVAVKEQLDQLMEGFKP